MTTKKNLQIEKKEVPFYLIKANDELGQVEAIVSVFGVLDLYNDVIHPGAYIKTITERTGKIRVLDNHRIDSVLAAVGKPLQMRELRREELPPELLEKFPSATGGLWTLTQFDMDTPEGEGAFKRLKSGTINEWSIGFDVLDWDKEKVVVDGKPILVRNLRTIRLWEYSVVLWGANQATETVLVKAHEGDIMPIQTKDSPPNYMTIPDANQHNACKNCYFKDSSGHCVKYAVQVDDGMICDSYQPRNEKSNDKSTDMEIEKTISAELIGAVYDVFSMFIAGYVKRGVVTTDEFTALIAIGAQLVDFVKTAIPLDIAERECGLDYGMMLWGHDGATDAKSFVKMLELKSGRVLSQSNLNKLTQALATIQEVLDSAGMTDAEEKVQEDKAGNQPQQVGSQDAPTFQDELNALREMQKKLKGET